MPIRRRSSTKRTSAVTRKRPRIQRKYKSRKNGFLKMDPYVSMGAARKPARRRMVKYWHGPSSSHTSHVEVGNISDRRALPAPDESEIVFHQHNSSIIEPSTGEILQPGEYYHVTTTTPGVKHIVHQAPPPLESQQDLRPVMINRPDWRNPYPHPRFYKPKRTRHQVDYSLAPETRIAPNYNAPMGAGPLSPMYAMTSAPKMDKRVPIPFDRPDWITPVFGARQLAKTKDFLRYKPASKLSSGKLIPAKMQVQVPGYLKNLKKWIKNSRENYKLADSKKLVLADGSWTENQIRYYSRIWAGMVWSTFAAGANASMSLVPYVRSVAKRRAMSVKAAIKFTALAGVLEIPRSVAAGIAETRNIAKRAADAGSIPAPFSYMDAATFADFVGVAALIMYFSTGIAVTSSKNVDEFVRFLVNVYQGDFQTILRKFIEKFKEKFVGAFVNVPQLENANAANALYNRAAQAIQEVAGDNGVIDIVIQ